jgi:aldehyde dehydrogenase (NAD+)
LWLRAQRHRIVRLPLGDVAIIATWNYPVQLLGVQLVQALMGGNRVVVKPSEHAPRTQALLLDLASVGLPAGTLDAVEPTRQAGEALLRERRFDHVVFTGSTAVGRAIAGTLAGSLTASTLELSGNDSAFVLRDCGEAHLRIAAESLWNALTLNSGQTCMAPRRVLVEAPAYDGFVDALQAAAERLGTGERKLINADAADRTHGLVASAVVSGGTPLPNVTAQRHADTLVPTAVVGCSPDAELTRCEHFGPAMAVVRVESVDEALRVHRTVDQHLTASVFTADPRRAERDLAPRLGAASVTINDCILPVVHPGTAIAGHGASGWGASQGEAGLRAMTREVHVATSGRRFRPPLGDPGEKQLRQLVGMLRLLYGRGGGPDGRAAIPSAFRDRLAPSASADAGARSDRRQPQEAAAP